MRSFTFAILFVVFAMVGCASPQVNELNAWADKALPQARAGEMKWSDYYMTLFERLSALPSHPDKGVNMQMASTMIKASQDYESGQLSKQQFDEAQRAVMAQSAAIEGQRGAESRARWAAALQKAGNDMTQSSQNYYRQQQQAAPAYKPPVVCESRNVNGLIQTICK